MTQAIIIRKNEQNVVVAGGQRVVVVTGSALLTSMTAQAKSAAESAADSAATALAAGNFIPGTLLDAHEATSPGDFFAVEYPAGIISYRRRTASGSAQLGTALTPQSFAAEMAKSRGKTHYTAEQPTSEIPGDAWLSPDGTIYERRSDIRVTAGGIGVVAGGIAPVTRWRVAASQPIAEIRQALVNEGIL